MIRPEDIQLAIMTVDRSPQYVHSTIASLLLSDPGAQCLKGLHLIAGQCDTAYLDCYRHNRQIHVHPMTAEESSRSGDWVIHHRACLNYYRCLTIPPRDYRGLCVCEDDIIFCQGFIRALLEIIDELESASREKFVVSAYLPGNLRLSPSSRGSRVGLYPPRMFFGTQCMYYPSAVVGAVAAAVFEKGVTSYEEPYDLAVRGYAASSACLYGPIRSLVQHVGQCSTGLGLFHASETFEGREQQFRSPVRII